jgi:hypothetical protein
MAIRLESLVYISRRFIMWGKCKLVGAACEHEDITQTLPNWVQVGLDEGPEDLCSGLQEQIQDCSSQRLSEARYFA